MCNETIHKLTKLLDLKSQNDFDLYVKGYLDKGFDDSEKINRS